MYQQSITCIIDGLLQRVIQVFQFCHMLSSEELTTM